MRFNIIGGVVCTLLILAEVLAEGEVEEYNLPPQTRSGKETYLAEIIEAPIETVRNEDAAEDQSRVEGDTEDESNEYDEDMSQNLIAVGPNFGSMAALVPANLNYSVFRAAGVGPRQIIGYVPISSPNGGALVFPAGGVRVVNANDNINLSEDTEIERAVRRQYAVRKSNQKRGNKNKRRTGYAVYRPYSMPNYYRRRRPNTSSGGRRRNGNKNKRYRSKNRGYSTVI